MKIILILLLIAIAAADPQPSGGAPCQNYTDCGGFHGGLCETFDNGSYCVCFEQRGDPNCSYQRSSKNLAGGLQFLCFIGVGGIGNFILGHIGHAVGQLILLLSGLILSCCLCCVMCGGALFGEKGLGGAAIIGVLLVCVVFGASLAGFIWSIVDGAFILQGKINDSNGYQLY